MTRLQAIVAVLVCPLSYHKVFERREPRAEAQWLDVPVRVADFDVLAQRRPGILTIDLARWGGIVVKRGEWSRFITADDIQEALRQ